MAELPDLPNNIGKRRRAKDPSGSFFNFTILDEIRIFQSTHPQKAIYLQRIRFDDERIEFRLGYYVIGKKPKMAGKWVWGQFATMLPAEDFMRLVQQAQEKDGSSNEHVYGWFPR